MLTVEDKRTILHCLGVCVLERALGPGIATKDPYLRTTTYLGVLLNTIRKAALNKGHKSTTEQTPSMLHTLASSMT